MNSRSEYFAGALFITGFILFVLVMTTHNSWFDSQEPFERAKFLVEATVGVGTLALAVVTAYNIFQTKDIISGDERRHMQSLAPFVTWTSAKTGKLEFMNNGNGLAMNVRASFDWMQIDVDSKPAILRKGGPFFDSPDHRMRQIKKRVDATVLQEREGDQKYLVWSFKQLYMWSVGDFLRIAAIPSKSAATSESLSLVDAEVEDQSESKVYVLHIRIDYQDQFGNPYSTVYDSGEDGEYKWERPYSVYPLT